MVMNFKRFSLVALALLAVGIFIASRYGSLVPKNANLAAIAGSGSGLIAHYAFDEGSGSQAGDSSGNGKSASLAGSPTWTAGSVGGALDFNGSNYAMSVGSVSVPSTFSVSAWVKPSANPEVGAFADRIVESAYNTGFALTYYNNGLQRVFMLSVKGNPLFANAPVPLGQWTHVTATFDGSVAKVYVNGNLDASDDFSGLVSPGSTNMPIYIGTYFNAPGELAGFRGSIDDVRVYDRALSSSEVGEIYAYSGGGETPAPAPSDTTAPSLSSVSASSVTESGATITWSSNEASDSQVEYGLTASYGNQTSLNSSLVTSHSVSLSSLSSNTTYHYRVKSRDAAGNLATSGDALFTTQAASQQTPTTYSLSVSKSGTGTGTVSGGSISCGSTCSQSGISAGASIVLTATPASGSTFAGWSGGCSGTGQCSLTVNSNVSVTATFTAQQAGNAPDAPSTIGGWAIAGNQVNVSWAPSLGSVVASKYNVYRNGTYIGYVAALPEERTWKDAGYYQDFGLSSNAPYTYHVKAVSAGGVESAASPSVTVTTLSSSQNGLIPPARVYDWTPGVNVGVPGGIPKNRTNVIDLTQAQHGGADKTGATDVSAILNAAIVSAPKDSVIYLPAGRYLLNNGVFITRSDVTIRGDGVDVTVLDCRAVCLTLRGVDFYNLPKYKVTSGAFKGSSQITFAADASVGDMVSISTRNDTKLPVISPTGYEAVRHHKAIIKQKSGNTYTISPPIIFDVDSANTQVEFVRPISFVGIEDLTADATIGKPQTGISFSSTYGSWIKNVRIKGSTNYILGLGDSLFCEIRHSHLDEGKTSGTNGAGLLMGAVTGCLVEDNYIGKSFPVIEINFGSTANVFSYNYLPGSANTNHGAHNSYNLYEGNVTEMIWADGYYGSESEDTFFRNYLNGFGFSIKRFSRNFNVVGNLIDGGHSLGQPNIGNGASDGFAAPSSGVYWKDWSAVTGLGIKATLASRISDSKGQFNVTSGSDRIQSYCGDELCLAITPDWGNSSNWGNAARYAMSNTARSGTVMTLEGGHGAALPAQGTQLGLWPRSEGFQELDLDVASSLLLRGNWYKGGSYRAGFDEGLHGYSLPSSLYLDSKPSWFGTLAWPPFNPSSPNTDVKAIPAGYRYINGTEAPGVTDYGGNTVPTSFTLTVAKAGTGSGTVTGTGISCGADCSQAGLSSGAQVVLTAVPAAGSTFTGWSGGGCSGSSLTCTATISSNTTVAATFASAAIIDTTAPTVSITVPSSGATLSGSVQIAATSSDAVGVVGVQWKLDGANLGSELLVAPYSGTWDTTSASNGSHTLTVVSRDAAGNSRTSASVAVTISNTAAATGGASTGSTGTTGSTGSSGGSSQTTTPKPVFTPTVPQVLPTVSVASCSSATRVFSSTLSIGMSHPDVKALQQLLNSTGFTVAASGPGSKGQETSVFGPATFKALQAFQAAKDIPSTGLFGPITRSVASLLPFASCAAQTTAQTATAATVASASTAGATFTLGLDFGSTGPEVTALQTLLSKYPEFYPERLVTGVFGQLTQKAVQRLQEYHKLSQPGDPAYGFVGPKTRALLNTLK